MLAVYRSMFVSTLIPLCNMQSHPFLYSKDFTGPGSHQGEQLRIYTHLNCSPYMYRPHPFPRAHTQEASGGLFGTINSPKVSLKGCEKGPV